MDKVDSVISALTDEQAFDAYGIMRITWEAANAVAGLLKDSFKQRLRTFHRC